MRHFINAIASTTIHCHNPSRYLIDILAEVPDPRNAKGKRHPLGAILGLAVIAMMCGYRSYSAIAEWGRTYASAWVQALGFTHAKTPCAATLHNLFKRLDIATLESALSQWVVQTLQLHPVDSSQLAVAIDGKMLNGSAKQQATVSHLLSVVSHQPRVTIAQQPVDKKTNEIPISTEILSAFDVKGMIVTTDALLTQRHFCKTVCALGADYVVPVGLNHKQLHQDIGCLFAPPTDRNPTQSTFNALQQMHTELNQTLDTHQTVDKSHGRIEIRRLTASTALNDYVQWPGVEQVFEYSYQRIELSTGQVKQKTQYSITSLSPTQASAKDLLALRRGHWTIENQSHWVRDVVLGEDASQVRSGVIPQIMSALRNTTLAVLRFADYTSISKAMRYFAAHPQHALDLHKRKKLKLNDPTWVRTIWKGVKPMSVSFNSAPILLTDEQMRQYIVDGYVMLEPSVPDELHETIRRKLGDVLEVGSNPGNNVLPRVPEMRHILNSPEVRGALISALGEGYIEHPHRYCHHLGPVTDPDPEPEIKLAANCHQDAYTPLGRPRQHYSRFARIMYYPQDTPIELGPTHAIPGTQYHKRLTDEDRAQAIPMVGKAGTVSLTHFDVGHAAGVNRLNQPRDMIKFVYVRASEPTAPSWDCQNLRWQNPAAIETPHNLELAWSHMWDWLCGKRDRYESFRSNGVQLTKSRWSQCIAALGEDQNLADRLRAIYDLAGLRSDAAEAISALISMLDNDHQAARVAAIYTLGAIGEPAVAPLMERLKTAGHREDAHPVPEPWNEGAISMEDAAHALTAIGSPAVPALTEALESSSEWVRINASFALGELDSHAASAVSKLMERLDDDSHRVVRTATDALGSIHQGAPTFIPRISRLLIEDLADWHEEERRGWTIQDQVRTNAAMAFTRLGKAAVGAEEVLFHAMDDPCGHVGVFAMDALRRIDSPAARQAVMAYLEAQRWDESITADRQF